MESITLEAVSSIITKKNSRFYGLTSRNEAEAFRLITFSRTTNNVDAIDVCN